MKRRILTVAISAIVGIGLGALSGRILFGGSAWNLIPWALGALVIGLIALDLGTTAIASGVYGYLLCAVFLFVANTSNTPLAQKVVFALALAVVGAACAIAIALATRVIVRRARPTPR